MNEGLTQFLNGLTTIKSHNQKMLKNVIVLAIYANASCTIDDCTTVVFRLLLHYIYASCRSL